MPTFAATISARADLDVDTLYVNEDTDATFVTPDAIGLLHYDSLSEAQDQHGDDLPVAVLEADNYDFLVNF